MPGYSVNPSSTWHNRLETLEATNLDKMLQ
jgi:hypothetical protein